MFLWPSTIATLKPTGMMWSETKNPDEFIKDLKETFNSLRKLWWKELD